MDDIFFSDEPITTLEQMNDAISTLFWYRVQLGLEYPIYFDLPWFEPLEPGLCSDTTNELYGIYAQRIVSNCCDARTINFYPLIDRIIEWMDKEYQFDFTTGEIIDVDF